MKKDIKIPDRAINILKDIQVPIHAQISGLNMFLETSTSNLSPEDLDYFKLMQNSAANLFRIVEIYNWVHKIEAKRKIRLNYIQFDFVKYLDKILDEFRIVFKYYNLKLEFRYRKEIFIYADVKKLRVALECILFAAIENAYKNTTLQITIIARNNNLQFQIRNKSDYMEPKLVDCLFDKDKPKYRSPYHSNRVVSYGFFVAKEIIHTHFGSMIAQSYEDNVNIFGFNIPIK